MSEIEYLTPQDISFMLNETGLIMASFRNENAQRVAVLRMFPFDYEEEYLSVRYENYQRTDSQKEIGIIRFLSSFPKEQQEIVRSELEKRYFIPEIVKVLELKDELGHTMWKTETTAGMREFTVTDMSTNVVRLGENKVMLIDVYGNRYYITDVSATDEKTMKTLEIWI